ncbi:MAG: alcohol dehydrogenase catalytic domain-containing protein [Acidobacteriota bacterium]
MLALVFDGEPRVKDVPEPEVREGEALVRVLLAGVCGTDLELLAGYKNFRGIPGHEMVGVVETAPDRAWVGVRVVAEINIACGACALCEEGLGNHCERRQVLGISGKPGAFAERVAIPLRNLHRVPDPLADEEAVWVEPLAAALGVWEEGVRKGDRVLVVGDGRLGALIALGLQTRGASVELAGKHREKTAFLRSLGIPIAQGAPRPRYPWVIEATGSTRGLEAARKWARPRGTVVLKSTTHEHSRVDVSQLVVNELRVVGSRCGPFGPALDALARRSLPVRQLVSKTYPLSRALEALEASGRPGVFKVLLDPRMLY